MKRESLSRIFILSIFAILVLSFFIGVVSAATTWEQLGGSSVWNVFRYIFGDLEAVTFTNDAISAAVVTIAVWLMIFITFSDIFTNFSTFSTPVSWGIGFLLAVIAANFNAPVVLIAWLSSFFVSLGVIAVYVGLGAAFVVFLLINLGVSSAGPWIKNRKAMAVAGNMKAGGTETAGAVRGLKQIGKALKEGA